MKKIDKQQIKWCPDRTSIIPLTKQIYDYMIGKIASGDWSISSKLPTQIELSKLFVVNRSTILEVYDELKYEGIVMSKKSVGTIIINDVESGQDLIVSDYAIGQAHKKNIGTPFTL